MPIVHQSDETEKLGVPDRSSRGVSFFHHCYQPTPSLSNGLWRVRRSHPPFWFERRRSRFLAILGCFLGQIAPVLEDPPWRSNAKSAGRRRSSAGRSATLITSGLG